MLLSGESPGPNPGSVLCEVCQVRNLRLSCLMLGMIDRDRAHPRKGVTKFRTNKPNLPTLRISLLHLQFNLILPQTQMFRRKPKNNLKEIEEWPTTLDGYGLFVTPADQVRLIHKPEEKMIYRLSNSMEYNDRRLAAFRRILLTLASTYSRCLVQYCGGKNRKIGDEKVESSPWNPG